MKNNKDFPPIDVGEITRQIKLASKHAFKPDSNKCVVIIMTIYDLLNTNKVNYGFRFMEKSNANLEDVITNDDGSLSRIEAII